MNIIRILKGADKILLAAVFFLTLIGVLELAGMAQNGQITTAQLGKQIASFGIGLALMLLRTVTWTLPLADDDALRIA